MLEFFANLFNTDAFPARWNCGEWTAGHGWLHIISDLATFGAYMAIPLVMVYFLRKRPDVPFPKVFYLFAAFVFVCGTVHLIEAGIFWWPVYRLSGLFKFATAIVSWGTVAAAIAVAPKALNMRSANELEREIEERKRVETSLRESEERYRSLFESISDMVQSVAPDGRILFVNPAWLNTLGYTEKEAIGRNVFDVVDEGCYEQCQNVLAKLTTGHGVGRVEIVFVAKDGRKVPAEGNVSGRFVDGEFVATHCFFRDASERIAAEEATTSLGRIIEESLDGILVVDAETMKFVQVNRGARQNLGYESDELTQMSPLDILTGHSSETIGELAEALRRDADGKCVIEAAHRRKDGSLFDAEVHLHATTHLGREAFVAFMRDVTEKNRSHQQLVQTERLSAIGQAMTGLVHESRNALAEVRRGSSCCRVKSRTVQSYLSSLTSPLRLRRTCSICLKKSGNTRSRQKWNENLQWLQT